MPFNWYLQLVLEGLSRSIGVNCTARVLSDADISGTSKIFRSTPPRVTEGNITDGATSGVVPAAG